MRASQRDKFRERFGDVMLLAHRSEFLFSAFDRLTLKEAGVATLVGSVPVVWPEPCALLAL